MASTSLLVDLSLRRYKALVDNYVPPHSTLKIASITPSSPFLVHTTVTQNKFWLAFTLITFSNTPNRNTLAKSIKIRSIGPFDSFRKH